MSTEKEEKKVFGLTKKQRSHAYTILFIIVFAIFFFVNNNFEEAKSGPYPPNYEAKVNPSSRTTAPDFSLATVAGSNLNLADYKGKVVVLDFWATWCAPCRKAIPDLIELKNEYPEDQFEIIGISLDSDTKEMVPSFVEQFKINYPIVYGDMEIARRYGDIQSIPTSFVVDKEGRIFSSYVGYMDKSIYKKDIDKLIEE
jgi:cytochrome c biogenesis protein CcmG/thiol:disulfide interchange protein DsbE